MPVYRQICNGMSHSFNSGTRVQYCMMFNFTGDCSSAIAVGHYSFNGPIITFRASRSKKNLLRRGTNTFSYGRARLL